MRRVRQTPAWNASDLSAKRDNNRYGFAFFRTCFMSPFASACVFASIRLWKRSCHCVTWSHTVVSAQRSDRGEQSSDGIVAVSKQTQCLVRASLIGCQHLPCPPPLSSIPPGIETSKLDELLVSSRKETKNPSFLLLLAFSLWFSESFVRRSSSQVFHSGQ